MQTKFLSEEEKKKKKFYLGNLKHMLTLHSLGF